MCKFYSIVSVSLQFITILFASNKKATFYCSCTYSENIKLK